MAPAFPCARGLVPAAMTAQLAAGFLVLALVVLGWTGAAAAQTLDPVTVVGHAPHSCPARRNGPDYACLNANLAATARGAQPLAGPTAADAIGNGAPDRVGVFSYSGISEQLGSNFGKSAFPQRPSPPAVYVPPLSAPSVPRPR